MSANQLIGTVETTSRQAAEAFQASVARVGFDAALREFAAARAAQPTGEAAVALDDEGHVGGCVSLEDGGEAAEGALVLHGATESKRGLDGAGAAQ